ISLGVAGDGEREPGALEGSWKRLSFLNPARDGAVLPILHLNGAKIAGPTVLARIPPSELDAMFGGMGSDPLFVEGSDPAKLHPLMARTLDAVVGRIRKIQSDARKKGAAKAV